MQLKAGRTPAGPMKRPPNFRRARQPEHKLERRMAILEAAKRLALRYGVAGVTLGHIGEAVGLAKSNVLRYFETREEIYLHLTAEGWRAWGAALERRLSRRPRERNAAATRLEVSNALAETLVAVPLFGQLLGQVTVNLEQNVSADAVRVFKLEVMSLIATLAVLLEKSLPATSRDRCAEIISATSLIAGAAWPIAHPPPHLAALYAADPRMTEFCFDYETELRRLVLALVTGFSRHAD